MCNNILNILKFIIKFNKYIIIVIDLKHFQNFPHCGVHLKRWKKKVHQVRKKNEHMLASKWINENITELICILTILFPFLLLKFIHPSIINQSLDNSPTAWLLYGRVLFWSFILPLGNIFFFSTESEKFLLFKISEISGENWFLQSSFQAAEHQQGTKPNMFNIFYPLN